MTLRHRTGEEPGAGTWTAELPAWARGGPGQHGAVVGRTSGGAARGGDGLFLGITRSSPLHQIVELVTTRCRFILADPAGVPRGELDDDTVTVAGGNRDGVCFRQIEVELGPGGDELAGRVVNRLISAGARPGGRQELAKAVDLPAPSRAGGSDPQGLADG